MLTTSNQNGGNYGRKQSSMPVGELICVCVCEMTKIIFTAMKKMASNVINSTTN